MSRELVWKDAVTVPLAARARPGVLREEPTQPACPPQDPTFKPCQMKTHFLLPFPVNYVGECIRTAPFTDPDHARCGARGGMAGVGVQARPPRLLGVSVRIELQVALSCLASLFPCSQEVNVCPEC